MGLEYRASGRSTANAATIDHVVAILWNQHATKMIHLREVHFYVAATGTGPNPGLIRTTTRGTPGSTVTPDIDNDALGLLAPISGALLDLGAYSVQPTLQKPYKIVTDVNAGIPGGGFAWVFGGIGIRVAAGTGVGIGQITGASIPASDVTMVWEE